MFGGFAVPVSSPSIPSTAVSTGTDESPASVGLLPVPPHAGMASVAAMTSANPIFRCWCM